MKKGYRSGFYKRSRAKRLVKVSLGGGYVLASPGDPSSTAVDIATSVLGPFNGKLAQNTTMHASIPAQGVVGLELIILGRNTTDTGNDYMVFFDWDDDGNPVGSTSPTGQQIATWYGSKVANFREACYISFIRTGGMGGTQFKYAIHAGAGTIQYYFRIIGYWIEVPA